MRESDRQADAVGEQGGSWGPFVIAARKSAARGAVFPLILECSRVHPDPGSIRRLAGQCQDWNRFIELAAIHRVAPLIFSVVNRACPDSLPPEALASVRNSFKRNCKVELALTTELARLLEAFDRAGIKTMPFKGPALASFLYDAPAMRVMSDLDLLVSERDVIPTFELLAANGYHCPSLGHGTRFFADARHRTVVGSEGRVQVDIHWGLIHARLGNLDAAAFSSRSVPISVAGRPAFTFCPEDLLLFLCVHGLKHAWGGLGWLVDLARLLGLYELDWDAVLSRAEEHRISRAVSLGLFLACGLLGSALPDEVQRRVQPDARTAALAASVTARLPQGGPSEVEELRFEYRSLESAVDRLRFVWFLLKPTNADYEAVRLPAWLYPAYYALRPLRIAWDWRTR
jgi:hypothetical protein